MAEFKVELPKMGESVAEATITTWLKAVGDVIEEDEPIVEIATDKVDSEVPAPCSGILKKVLFNEGDVVEVGSVFAIIDSEVSSESQDTPPLEPNISNEEIDDEVEQEILEPLTNTAKVEIQNNFNNSNKFYSPLVKSIASKEGISLEELETINGTGSNHRVTKKDILNYISSGKKSNSSETIANTNQPVINTPKTVHTISGQDEIIEMDRTRKLIADHMVNSVNTAPHVTSFVEADVTNLVLWRNKTKKDFLEKEGEKLTFTPIFIEAIAKALRDYPLVNSSIDGDNIVVKSNINIGMATALPSET